MRDALIVPTMPMVQMLASTYCMRVNGPDIICSNMPWLRSFHIIRPDTKVLFIILKPIMPVAKKAG